MTEIQNNWYQSSTLPSHPLQFYISRHKKPQMTAFFSQILRTKIGEGHNILTKIDAVS